MLSHLSKMGNKQSGFSLVELMVAMTVSLLLLGGMMQIFVSTKQSYRSNEALSRIQENARFAVDLIAQDLRHAQFWGCAKPSADPTNTIEINGAMPAGFVFNGTIDADGGLDVDEAAATADVLFIRGAFGVGAPVVAHAGTGQPIVLSPVNGSPVFQAAAANRTLVVSNCDQGEIFTIPDAVINAGAGVPAPAGGYRNTYDTDAFVYEARQVKYEINAANNTLTREVNGGNANTVVGGIENLQIEYGVDTDSPADGIPNLYDTPANAATLAGFSPAQVVSIRFTMVLISDDNASSVSSTNSLNNALTDNRYRQRYVRTIQLRNRL